MTHKIALADAFGRFTDHWNPRIIGEVSGHEIRIAKIRGAFDWHLHDDTDECFLVHKGRFRMEFRDHVVDMEPGDVLVVPQGVEHRPVADDECEIVLFERVGTRNTGQVVTERTRETLERLHA
ncbi:MAG: cupin domain-containing protein [Gemmatimonadaceae bacterium]|jgi:mannose-6-phosphate isomerase-like protein (cupin superfamily)|nr:cupin domain-containing protein [Gemmatimonadaceae bacterium]